MHYLNAVYIYEEGAPRLLLHTLEQLQLHICLIVKKLGPVQVHAFLFMMADVTPETRPRFCMLLGGVMPAG